MKKCEEYYRLGIRYANKLINAAFSENPRKELENLIQRERTRTNKSLVWKELCYFMFGVSTILISLNKESIEESGINSSYEYDINKKLKNNFDIKNIFSTKCIKENKYDSWLNITNCDVMQFDFIFNVRNGLLHSEFEPTDNIYIYNVHNSNYTNFEAEIYFPNFWEFIYFYFGNSNNLDAVSLKPQINVIGFDKEIEVNNENDLEKLLDSIKISNVIRNDINNKKIAKTVENKLIKNTNKEGKIFLSQDMFNSKNLTFEEKQILKKIIEFNKKDFYSIKFEDQIKYICSLYNLIKNPNYSVSNWINYYAEILSCNVEEFNKNSSLMIFGTGLDKIAPLFIKLSFVLYRLQNTNFEEINYNLLDIDLDNIRYYEEGDINGISPFAHAYNKFKNKDYNKTDKELKLSIFCDIIRNSISHGNIETEFDKTSGELFVNFIDNYKQKKRTLKLTIEELKKFLMSSAFESTKCIIKEKDLNKKI